MATIQKYYFPNPYYEGRRSLATNYAVGLADVEAQNKAYEAEQNAKQEQAALIGGTAVLGAGLGALAAPAAAAAPVGSIASGFAGPLAPGLAATATGTASGALSGALSGAAIGAGFGNALAGGGVGPFIGAVEGSLNREQRGQESAADRQARRELAELGYQFAEAQQGRGFEAQAARDERVSNLRLYEDAVQGFQSIAMGVDPTTAAAPIGSNASSFAGPLAPGVDPSTVGGAPRAAFRQPGLPLPMVNPTAVPLYRQAEQDAYAAIDEFRAIQQDDTIPIPERTARISALTQRMAAAQQVLKPYQQPPPPTDYDGLKAVGPHGGGIAPAPDGGFFMHKDLKYMPGSKASPYTEFIQSAVESGIQGGLNPFQATEQADRLYVESKIGREGRQRIINEGGSVWADPDGKLRIEGWPPKDAEGEGGFDEKLFKESKYNVDTYESRYSNKQTVLDRAKLKNHLDKVLSDPEIPGIQPEQYRAIIAEAVRLYGRSASKYPEEVARALELLESRMMRDPLDETPFLYEP